MVKPWRRRWRRKPHSYESQKANSFHNLLKPTLEETPTSTKLQKPLLSLFLTNNSTHYSTPSPLDYKKCRERKPTPHPPKAKITPGKYIIQNQSQYRTQPLSPSYAPDLLHPTKSHHIQLNTNPKLHSNTSKLGNFSQQLQTWQEP